MINGIMKYFDILFVRIYLQYIKWNEKDIPKLYSILILSLFQSLNVLALYFLAVSVFLGNKWHFSNLYTILIMFLVLFIDYVRFFKVIGFDNLLSRYNEPSKRKILIHPVIYFILSIGILVLLKVFKLYPEIE